MGFKTIPNEPGVYKIVNLETGEFYIGSSNNLRTRKNYHFHKLRKGQHENPFLQEDVNTKGVDILEFQVIALCSKEEALAMEQKFIDELNPQYNVSPTAGSMEGFKHTEETKKKISESMKSLAQKKLEQLDEDAEGVDLSGFESAVRVEGLTASADPKKDKKEKQKRGPRNMNPNSLRGLHQYKNLTDEEWEVKSQELMFGIKSTHDFEKLIKAKMAEFEKHYDLRDMKYNDIETLRALCQAIITLEKYEQQTWSMLQLDVEDQDPNIMNFLERWKSDLRKSISQLSADLNISRSKRQSEGAESVVQEIENLKEKAKKFYAQKTSFIFCPDCKHLVGSVWALYPESNKGNYHVPCEKCKTVIKVRAKDIYENGKAMSNIPSLMPEGL